jgi:hypothetical protein
MLGLGEREAAVRRHERPHGDIDVGREAPAQPNLLLAHSPPALERPVVEEGEDDRLLDLEHSLPRQQQPRDVRLDELDRRPPVVHRRVSQGLDRRRERGRGHAP